MSFPSEYLEAACWWPSLLHLPVYRRVFCLMFFIYYLMYTIEYWHEYAAEWRHAGQLPRGTREAARARMRELTIACDYLLSFRIIPIVEE